MRTSIHPDSSLETDMFAAGYYNIPFNRILLRLPLISARNLCVRVCKGNTHTQLMGLALHYPIDKNYIHG